MNYRNYRNFRSAATAFLLIAVLGMGARTNVVYAKAKPKPALPALPELKEEQIYLPAVFQWTVTPVKPGGEALMTAPASIAVFYPSGEFVGSEVWVKRGADGTLTVLPEQGFAVRRGKWELNGTTLNVDSYWVKYDKAFPLNPKKDKKVKETWSIDPRVKDKKLSSFMLRGRMEYMQANSLENLDTLSQILND